jgi:hypothetical protein
MGRNCSMAARVVFRGGSKVIQSHDEHLLFLLGIPGTCFSFQIIYARIFLGKAPSRLVFFHFSSLLRFATQNNQLNCSSKKTMSPRLPAEASNALQAEQE